MDTGLSPLRVSRQGQGHPHTRKIPLAGGTLMLAPHPVAPPSAHQLLVFLLQLGLLLALALALGRLATRLRMPAVAGELCAGVLLGPSLLDNLAPGVAGWMFPKDPAQIHLLDAFGQIGVLLLVGVAGIQLDFGLVRRHGLTAARISIAGLVIPLAFGIGCCFVLPASFMVDTADRGVFALFLGVAMCVSAIPVIAKTLMDMGLLHRNIGQLTLAAGMVDDAFGWLLLSIVSGLATVGMIATKAMLSLSYLLGVILIAWLAARPLVRIVLRAACRSREPGTQISAVIVMILLSAAATHALGLEPIFGAFTCGVLIGTSEVMRPADLVPLRTMVLVFLAPVFFATAGLRTDFTALGRPLVLGAALLVLSTAVVGKFAGAFVGARLSRLGRWEAIALGAGMNARGVIEIVVATVGLRIGVLTTETYTIVVLVAIATSLMAPPILRSAMRRVEQPAEERARAETFALPMRAE